MPLEEKKLSQNEGVRGLLNEDHKEELGKILAFGEKYKKEGERMKKEFWNTGNFDSKSIFIDLVLKYEESKKKFIEGWLMEEEKEILESLDGVAKEKFYKEYLYDRILYGDSKSGERHFSKVLPYSSDKFDVKGVLQWIKDIKDRLEPRASINLDGVWIGNLLVETIAEEWKDNLQMGMQISLALNNIGAEGVKVLTEKWKDKLKPEMCISLWENEIGDEGVKILAETWKDSLQPGMTIDLCNNGISLEGIKTLAETWKGKLPPGMKISLSDEIGDEGVKILAETWKDSLQPGMTIDLGQNQIGDEGVKILAETWKDKLQPGMKIDLSKNKIGDEGEQRLESLEQSHKNKGINCYVYVK